MPKSSNIENTYLEGNIKKVGFITSISHIGNKLQNKIKSETISYLCKEAKLTKHAGANYIQHCNISL